MLFQAAALALSHTLNVSGRSPGGQQQFDTPSASRKRPSPPRRGTTPRNVRKRTLFPLQKTLR